MAHVPSVGCPAELHVVRQLADHLPQLVFATHPDGDCDYLSQKWVAFTGVAELDHLGQGWVAAIHPDDRAETTLAWARFLSGHPTYEIRHRLRHHSGAYRWFHAQALRLTTAEGTPGAIVVTCTEAEPSADLASLEQDGRYRTLFAEMDQGFCIIEPIFDATGQAVDYRFVEVNRAFAAHSGLHDATGQTACELVPGLDPFWATTYGRVVITGEPVHVKHRMKLTSGQWFDVYAYRIGLPTRKQVAVLFTNVTARELAEEAIRLNKSWLQTVINSLPAIVSYVDRQLAYRFVNQAYEQWFDRPADSMVGKTMPELLGSHEFAMREQHVRAALRGETVQFEMPTTHVRRGLRQTEMVYTPHWQDGEVVGFFIHSVDITHRHETERRLDLAIEIARLGTFDMDMVTDQVTVNNLGRGILGLAAPGETLTVLMRQIHPDDEALATRHLLAAFDPAGAGMLEVEHRIIRSDGQTRWIRVLGRTFFTGEPPARRAIRCLGTFLDITDRKQAEVALRENERRLREVADTAPATLWATDPQGQCTFLSSEWYECTGQTEIEALGLGWVQAIHPDDRPRAT